MSRRDGANDPVNQHNAGAWLVDRRVESGDGERVAYRCEGRATTYAELQQELWRVQHAMDVLEVRRGERVALVLDDSVTFPAWFLGAMRSGVVPVPLSTMLTGEDLAGIVTDAEAPYLIISAAYGERLATIVARSPYLRHVVFIGPSTVAFAPPVNAHNWDAFEDRTEARLAVTREDSPGFWLYSSGTTGMPKGVMHRHGALRATAETYAKSVLEIGPDDRCLSVPKLFFAFGLGNSLTFPLSVGATAILEPRRPTPAGLLELIRREQPTLFFSSPGFVAALLDSDVTPDALASIRATITAGEALPADLQRRFQARFGHPILDGIGTTEALHIFLSNTRGFQRPGTSGQPVAGYRVRLVDTGKQEVTEPEVPGYLQVCGPSLATGYWCRDDATRAAFQGEWLSTGDVYTRSEDDYWTFLGRNNDMIKAGGIWVSPAEVEAVLIEHPDILECAVVGARDADELETTVAFLVPRSGREIDPASIEIHCRARMAAFKRPRRIIVVKELPKTATGKVQRFALRDQLHSSPSDCP
ncbi:MAG: benzoate-CoA ligase family protein [Actinomycetota bacterium]|nr:benzoate-CoA ligase family protein [Actinomycetota bacterium]